MAAATGQPQPTVQATHSTASAVSLVQLLNGGAVARAVKWTRPACAQQAPEVRLCAHRRHTQAWHQTWFTKHSSGAASGEATAPSCRISTEH